MVRLVFRPYAQIRRSICTSEPLRPSTRVSSGFSLFRHSSPSFGSQQARSCSTPRTRPMGSAGDAPTSRISPRLPSLCFRVSYCPTPRARVRLLGPCFKTGRRGHRPTRQRDGDCNRALLAIRVSSITCLAQSQNIRGYKLGL